MNVNVNANVKKTVKRLAEHLGFEIRRTKARTGGTSRSYPYLESFAMRDIRFDYWITDDTYRSWYEPTAQAAWDVNEGYLDLVRPGDKVLEVGCNAGFTTCLLSRAVGKEGMVLGLDIIPSNCLVAAAQIGLNGITNARVLHLGAGDFNGTIRVNNTNNGTVQTDSSSDDGIEVNVTRCDELIPQFGHFDVLKVDVEGFESQVFKGAPELLSKRPRLLLEVHGPTVEHYGSSYEELFRLINVQDYEGLMVLDPNNPASSNKLQPFDLDVLLRTRLHANLFLRPKVA